MTMTHKQRILAAARGETPDRLAFGARIDTWYNYHLAHNSLPEKYEGWSQTDITADQGAGSQKRFFSICEEEYRDMEVIVRNDPPYETKMFKTPLGDASIKLLWSTGEGPWLAYEQEKLFKSENDYPIVKYILDHTEAVYDAAGYERERAEMGERGMVMTGLGLWSPAQRIMREIMGYERFFYELMDRPEMVEGLIESMKNLERRKLKIALESDLEIINLCANWSDDIHTPAFRRYFTPWFQEAAEAIHARGKLAMAHCDGEMRRLIPLFAETHLDIAEAITPAPQTRVSMREFRMGMGEHVTLWGGIPSILFEPGYTDEEFRGYVENLFREMAPGTRFIVGMGDNLPFDGEINRVGIVAELIEEYGVPSL